MCPPYFDIHGNIPPPIASHDWTQSTNTNTTTNTASNSNQSAFQVASQQWPPVAGSVFNSNPLRNQPPSQSRTQSPAQSPSHSMTSEEAKAAKRKQQFAAMAKPSESNPSQRNGNWAFPATNQVHQ